MNTESIFNCSYKNAQRRTRLRFKNVLVLYSRKLDRQIKSELTKTIVKSIILIEYVTMRAFETQAYIKFLYLMWEFRNVIPSPTRIFGKVSLKNNIYDIWNTTVSHQEWNPNYRIMSFLLWIIRLSIAFVARVTERRTIVAVSRGELNDNGIYLMLVLYAKCNGLSTAATAVQMAKYILYR